MNQRTAYNQWLALQAGNLRRTEALGDLSRAVAADFMEKFFSRSLIGLWHVELLCEMAVHPAPEFSRPTVQALYGTIIEGLCDDFSEEGVRACNLVLLRVLAFVSGHPRGRSIAVQLARCGIRETAQLLGRYERIRYPAPLSAERCRQAEKIVILSRVSAGADIAITSIIVQRLLETFSRAEFVMLGPSHLAEFFSAPRLRWLPLEYPRQGSLFARMRIWPEVLGLISREFRGVARGGLLVFDPDTRLSQLGLLPFVQERFTFYLSSRANLMLAGEPSLAELTNGWLDQLLPERRHRPPALFLPPPKLLAARRYAARLRRAGAARIILINLGVGGDSRKRVTGRFEKELLAAVLQTAANTVIILDTGGDSIEKERVGMLLTVMRGMAIPVSFLSEEEIGEREPIFSHGVIGFSGSLGALGGLLAIADGYLGYDSCGQHMASALGTPAVIVFAGAPNRRFSSRWRPPATTTTTIVVEKTALSVSETKELVQRAASELHNIGKEE